jgi:hypothetical protein
MLGDNIQMDLIKSNKQYTLDSKYKYEPGVVISDPVATPVATPVVAVPLSDVDNYLVATSVVATHPVEAVATHPVATFAGALRRTQSVPDDATPSRQTETPKEYPTLDQSNPKITTSKLKANTLPSKLSINLSKLLPPELSKTKPKTPKTQFKKISVIKNDA